MRGQPPVVLSIRRPYASCRASAPARAARAPMAVRVARGQRSWPAVRVEATQTLMQNGQVASSPAVWRPPSGFASSCSSAGPCGATYRVKGARSGLVTDALVRSLLSRNVAIEFPDDPLDGPWVQEQLPSGSVVGIAGRALGTRAGDEIAGQLSGEVTFYVLAPQYRWEGCASTDHTFRLSRP